MSDLKRLSVSMPQVEVNPELFEKLLTSPSRIMEVPEQQFQIGTKITDVGIRYSGDDIALLAWLPPEIVEHIRRNHGSLENVEVYVTYSPERKDNDQVHTEA